MDVVTSPKRNKIILEYAIKSRFVTIIKKLGLVSRVLEPVDIIINK